MANPRRIAWLLVAAQVGAATFAISPPVAAQARPSDDEEDEEDPPVASTSNTPPSASPPPAAAAPGQPTEPSARPRHHDDFPSGEETENQREERRDRMIHRFSSLSGAIGLVHLQSAEAGSEQTFRFSLIAEYFGARGFLRPTMNATHPLTTTPEDSSRIGATITASYSPIRYLEIFTALRSFAVANNQERPSLFQVLGDAQIGAKGVFPLTRGFSIGASAAALLLNRAGGIGLNGEGTSANFRILSTFDLGQLTNAPIRIHLNVGYDLDNSAQLVRDTEVRRQMAQPTYRASDCETPSTSSTSAWATNPACHAEITRGERFALGINRADRLTVGIGVDARIATSAIGFAPFVEWNAPIPVVRSGYICWQPSSTIGSPTPGDDDRCYADQGTFAVMPSSLTLGTRLWTPHARGLAGILAVDIGTGGTNTFVRELAPNVPWNLYFGLGFAHDFNPRVRNVTVDRLVERVVDRDNTPVGGELIGTITDGENRRPIANAVVEIVGHPEFGLSATDAQGRFRTHRLPVGSYELRVRATDYGDNTCPGAIAAPAGDTRSAADTTVDCQLRIVARHGIVAGRVTNEQGAGVGGVQVILTPGTGITVPQGESAPIPVTATTSADGAYRFETVLAGSWVARADQGPQTRGSAPRTLDVRARETAAGDLQVAASDTRGFRIAGRQVTVPDQVHFGTDSANIQPDSQTLLERIADFLNRHPELRVLEIQGHTDNQGPRPRNVALSQERADAVRNALIALGVTAERLTARGFGPDRPVAPNITAGGRTRNRRVVFQISQRGR
ncbi:MAG: OmpA family protein [Deltaproteobacteria bacterium]|nr:OmpA family protein [Deltaproteobacteria bacterium]